MLAVLPTAAEVLPQHRWEAVPGDVVGDGADARGRHQRSAAQHDRAVVGHPQPGGVELGGRYRPDEDLAALRQVLQADRRRDDRTDGEQLTVAVSHEQQVHVAGLEPDGHREAHPPAPGAEPPERPERREQPLGAARSAARVPVAGEQEQKRVATELDEIATGLGRHGQQPAEDVVEDVGKLLRADLALPSEPLGQRREAGDVGEQDRPVDGAPAGIRVGRQPVERNAREVGREGVDPLLLHRTSLTCSVQCAAARRPRRQGWAV